MRRAFFPTMIICIAVLLIALTVSLSDAAILYRWVDDRGVVHVSETPPQGKASVAQVVAGDEADKGQKVSPPDEKKPFHVRPGEVTIYTTPTCPWCHKAKAWLRDKKIRYKEVDVTADRNGHEEMVRISGQTGVPVIVAGSEVIIGFNQGRLDEIFKD